jgi:hypothetical protein
MTTHGDTEARRQERGSLAAVRAAAGWIGRGPATANRASVALFSVSLLGAGDDALKQNG